MNKDEKNKDLENIVAGALAEWVLRKMYNTDQSVFVAKRVIEAGHRKVADDEIVVKNSEYQALKKDYDEWKDEYDHNCLLRLEVSELEKQLEQARQETRAILQELWNKRLSFSDLQFAICDMIAKYDSEFE